MTMLKEVSVLERLEQEELAELQFDYDEARIVPGLARRWAVCLRGTATPWTQWWEHDTLADVRARIVWVLANR